MQFSQVGIKQYFEVFVGPCTLGHSSLQAWTFVSMYDDGISPSKSSFSCLTFVIFCIASCLA